MLSRSVLASPAPSAPLAGTSRLHRRAAYPRCLRCAGAPRRPASGSGLSLPFRPDMPSSLTPGSSTSHVSRVAMPTRPSPRSERLGTPNTPAIRFTRGSLFEASLVRVCYSLSGCSPPWTDRTKFPWPTGDFYIQASGGSVALPAAGYDYNSLWTPLLAGLSPAGMAASLAAPDPSGPNSGTRLPPWVSDGEAVLQLAVRGPAPVTRLPGPEPGACFAGARPPRPPPFPPPPPQTAPRCFSPASPLLGR